MQNQIDEDQKDSKYFECSFCNAIMEIEKSKYKISTIKTPNGNTWRKYTTTCPDCGREITALERI